MCTQRIPMGPGVIVGSMNLGYVSDTARNRTHNLCAPIPLDHSDGQWSIINYSSISRSSVTKALIWFRSIKIVCTASLLTLPFLWEALQNMTKYYFT